MRTIALSQSMPTVLELLQMAKAESLVLQSQHGERFFLALMDDFEREVESLRNNPTFLDFLDERSRENEFVSLDEIKQRLSME